MSRPVLKFWGGGGGGGGVGRQVQILPIPGWGMGEHPWALCSKPYFNSLHTHVIATLQISGNQYKVDSPLLGFGMATTILAICFCHL